MHLSHSCFVVDGNHQINRKGGLRHVSNAEMGAPQVNLGLASAGTISVDPFHPLIFFFSVAFSLELLVPR